MLALVVVWTAVASGSSDHAADGSATELLAGSTVGIPTGAPAGPPGDTLDSTMNSAVKGAVNGMTDPERTVANPPATGDPQVSTDTQASADTQVTASAPLPDDQLACVYADDPAPRAELAEWQHTVLDTRFKLPPDYAPDDLVELAAALADVAPGAAPAGIQLRAVVLSDLRALLSAADAAGVKLAIQSAYRSYSYQESTFAYWVQQDGYEQALRSSARPGHSEHQLGTAMDFRSLAGPEAWDLDDWATTPEGTWTSENAWRFGFVMSYPAGAEGVTCYMYEPWHYRYVGRELAAAVRASGLTLREYLLAHLVPDAR